MKARPLVCFLAAEGSELLLSCRAESTVGSQMAGEFCFSPACPYIYGRAPQIHTFCGVFLPKPLLGWPVLLHMLYWWGSMAQRSEGACSEWHTRRAGRQGRFYGEAGVKGSLSLLFSPSLSACSCPANPPCHPFEVLSAPPHPNFPHSPVSCNVNAQEDKTQNRGHEGKCEDGVIPR